MTRWFLLGSAVGSLVGCTVTVSSDPDKSATTDEPIGDDDDVSDTDTTGDDDDDDDDDDGETTDTDTTDTDPDPSCDGSYVGTYAGAESGTFDAFVDSTTMSMTVADVEQSGFIDGIVGIEADGSLYGQSQGVWMDGTLDWGDCTMSGDWGIVEAPGVALGTWRID